MNKKLYLLMVALMTVSLAAGCSSKSTQTPQPTQTSTGQTATPAPAATAKVVVDIKNQKNGCADCHAPGSTVKKPDGTTIDTSLSAEVKNLSGHPPVDANATVKVCLDCHNKSPEKKQAIANKLHDVHLNSKPFTVTYKQTCSGCHDMKTIKQ